MQTSISLIFPVFNQADAIGRLVADADAVLRSLTTRFEVIVVDDGSRDATPEVVSHLTERFQWTRLIRHPVRRGAGAALRSGMTAATSDFMALAEHSSPIDHLGRMLPWACDHDVIVDASDPPAAGWRRQLFARGINSVLGRFAANEPLVLFRRYAMWQLLSVADSHLRPSELVSRSRQLGWQVAEVNCGEQPLRRAA